MSASFGARDPSSSPGWREFSAAAERARERVRGEFDELRIGIEELQADGSGDDGFLFAASDGAERARERVRGEFDKLRVGIEKLRAKEEA